jgi:hypothetical protein
MDKLIDSTPSNFHLDALFTLRRCCHRDLLLLDEFAEMVTSSAPITVGVLLAERRSWSSSSPDPFIVFINQSLDYRILEDFQGLLPYTNCPRHLYHRRLRPGLGVWTLDDPWIWFEVEKPHSYRDLLLPCKCGYCDQCPSFEGRVSWRKDYSFENHLRSCVLRGFRNSFGTRRRQLVPSSEFLIDGIFIH